MASQHKHARILLPLLCLLPLLLSSCDLFGGDAKTQRMQKAPANKQVYTIPVATVADFDTLDPALVHDSVSSSAVQMLYTGLVSLNNKLQVQPQLARTWEQSSDGLSWTFHLKPKLQFSDGTALTSEDVAYSLDRALQPETKSTVAPLYLGLLKDSENLLAERIPTLIGDSILTPDPATITLVLKKRGTYFLSQLTMPCALVVQKSLVTQYGATFTDHLNEAGGSGPFKVSQYAHGRMLDLVPNPHYYNAHPQLQRVSFAFYTSTDETYQAYQNAKVDSTAVPLATLEKERARKDFHQVPQLWTNYYTMNYRVKPFTNVHIRQAFALAVDKTALAKNIWQGTVRPTNHIIPEGMTGYNPRLNGPDGTQNLKGNPGRAKELLQQGLTEEGLSALPEITLTYAQDVPQMAREVTSLLEMWQKVLGVTVATDPVTYTSLLDKVTASTNNATGLQFWALSWVGEYPDPQDWLSLQFGRGEANNNMNYGQNTGRNAAEQQAAQQLLETADVATQDQVRLQNYQQAEQQLVNDVAWLPTGQVVTTFLRSPFIVGISDNAQGLIPADDWANIYRVQPAN